MTAPAIAITTETNGSWSTGEAAFFALVVEVEAEDGDVLDALVDVALLVVRLEVPFVEDVAESQVTRTNSGKKGPMGGCVLLEQREFSSALAVATSADEQFSRQVPRAV
jgi:hypothetical protein